MTAAASRTTNLEHSRSGTLQRYTTQPASIMKIFERLKTRLEKQLKNYLREA
jgi:hypothetical protein